MADPDIVRYDLSYASPEWNPQTKEFERQEAAITDSCGKLKESGDRIQRNSFFISSVTTQDSSLFARYIAEMNSQAGAVLMTLILV